jgi:Uma2 family endonuclease
MSLQADVEAEPQGRMTEAEYLAFEAASPTKHEYVLGWVRALAGANRQHNRVTRRVDRLLTAAADTAGCEVFGSDMRLRVSGGIYYYPNLVVVCDPTDTDPMNVTRPCVIVEVASPGTVSVDRGEKLLAYRGLDSLQAYLLV